MDQVSDAFTCPDWKAQQSFSSFFFLLFLLSKALTGALRSIYLKSSNMLKRRTTSRVVFDVRTTYDLSIDTQPPRKDITNT